MWVRVVALVMLGAVLSGAAGAFVGYREGLRVRAADADLRVAAAARVMEIVTERNPGARIVDWAGWPGALASTTGSCWR